MDEKITLAKAGFSKKEIGQECKNRKATNNNASHAENIHIAKDSSISDSLSKILSEKRTFINGRDQCSSTEEINITSQVFRIKSSITCSGNNGYSGNEFEGAAKLSDLNEKSIEVYYTQDGSNIGTLRIFCINDDGCIAAKQRGESYKANAFSVRLNPSRLNEINGEIKKIANLIVAARK